MALFKFQNLNKHGNLRTRIVHSPTSQFSFNPSGYGKFVNVQRFYYEMKHTYLSASLYTDAKGDKFILPSIFKVKKLLVEIDDRLISFSFKSNIFKAFSAESGIIGYNKKLIFLIISNAV